MNVCVRSSVQPTSFDRCGVCPWTSIYITTMLISRCRQVKLGHPRRQRRMAIALLGNVGSLHDHGNGQVHVLHCRCTRHACRSGHVRRGRRRMRDHDVHGSYLHMQRPRMHARHDHDDVSAPRARARVPQCGSVGSLYITSMAATQIPEHA